MSCQQGLVTVLTLTGLQVTALTATLSTSGGDGAAVSGQGTVLTVKDMRAEGNWTNATFDPDVVLPPAWAFGVLHGYYTNQAGILRNLKRLEAGDFPQDAIWVDSAFWDSQFAGS